MLFTSLKSSVYPSAPSHAMVPLYQVGTLVKYQGTHGVVVNTYKKRDGWITTIVTKEDEVYTVAERFLSYHLTSDHN